MTFEIRNQTTMGEAELRPVALLSDLKDDIRSFPLALIFDEGQGGIRHMPNDFYTGNKFRYRLLRIVDVRDTVSEGVANFVGCCFCLFFSYFLFSTSSLIRSRLLDQSSENGPIHLS